MSKLFSAENREALTGPLNLNNPVAVQVLGICSALAVTSQLEPAIVMGLSVTIITAFANVIISLLRKTIPNRIRIIVQLVVGCAGQLGCRLVRISDNGAGQSYWLHRVYVASTENYSGSYHVIGVHSVFDFFHAPTAQTRLSVGDVVYAWCRLFYVS